MNKVMTILKPIGFGLILVGNLLVCGKDLVTSIQEAKKLTK